MPYTHQGACMMVDQCHSNILCIKIVASHVFVIAAAVSEILIYYLEIGRLQA